MSKELNLAARDGNFLEVKRLIEQENIDVNGKHDTTCISGYPLTGSTALHQALKTLLKKSDITLLVNDYKNKCGLSRRFFGPSPGMQELQNVYRSFPQLKEEDSLTTRELLDLCVLNGFTNWTYIDNYSFLNDLFRSIYKACLWLQIECEKFFCGNVDVPSVYVENSWWALTISFSMQQTLTQIIFHRLSAISEINLLSSILQNMCIRQKKDLQLKENIGGTLLAQNIRERTCSPAVFNLLYKAYQTLSENENLSAKLDKFSKLPANLLSFGIFEVYEAKLALLLDNRKFDDILENLCFNLDDDYQKNIDIAIEKLESENIFSQDLKLEEASQILNY